MPRVKITKVPPEEILEELGLDDEEGLQTSTEDTFLGEIDDEVQAAMMYLNARDADDRATLDGCALNISRDDGLEARSQKTIGLRPRSHRTHNANRESRMARHKFQPPQPAAKEDVMEGMNEIFNTVLHHLRNLANGANPIRMGDLFNAVHACNPAFVEFFNRSVHELILAGLVWVDRPTSEHRTVFGTESAINLTEPGLKAADSSMPATSKRATSGA